MFDGEINAGKTREAQTTLSAGQYLALLNEGEGPGKVHTSFTVAAAASPVALPTPQATIRTIEFGFRGPTVLHDGELVRFENEGFLVHMDFAFPVKSKKAAKKVVKALASGKGKGAGKARRRRTHRFRGTDLDRRLPAGNDHRQAGLVCAGVLHGNPGQAPPHAPGHGADHQDHQVESSAP